MTLVKRALAVAGLAFALLASCSPSGDDDAGGPDGDATTTAEPAVTTTTEGPASPDELAAAVCAAQRAPGRLRVADPELDEISGIASLRSGLWADNDSGDSARLFRIDENGQTLAVLNFEGIEATDWEDLAGLSGEAGDELFAADIGDNAGARPEIQVQHIDVPDPVPTGDATVAAVDIQTITLRYPEGPRDAETLMVDPLTRDLVVVHKVFGGDSEVYEAPEADWSDGDATLALVGTVAVGNTPLDATTAGDVGFGGYVVALRTYSSVLVFARRAEQSLAEALVTNPSCDGPTAIEVQGEALAFRADEYVTISEGVRPRINRFSIDVPGSP
jgi:hypothetical protein